MGKSRIYKKSKEKKYFSKQKVTSGGKIIKMSMQLEQNNEPPLSCRKQCFVTFLEAEKEQH